MNFSNFIHKLKEIYTFKKYETSGFDKNITEFSKSYIKYKYHCFSKGDFKNFGELVVNITNTQKYQLYDKFGVEIRFYFPIDSTHFKVLDICKLDLPQTEEEIQILINFINNFESESFRKDILFYQFEKGIFLNSYKELKDYTKIILNFENLEFEKELLVAQDYPLLDLYKDTKTEKMYFVYWVEENDHENLATFLVFEVSEKELKLYKEKYNHLVLRNLIEKGYSEDAWFVKVRPYSLEHIEKITYINKKDISDDYKPSK